MCVESGGQIITTQHGGNYGNEKVYSLVSETEYAQFKFVSWGWIHQEDYSLNAYPLPSPYLTKYENRHNQKNNDLIFVGTRVHLFNYRYDSHPQPLEQLTYLKNKKEFFLGLDKKIFKNSLYRPYLSSTNGCLNDDSYILKYFPTLKIVKGELHPQILSCKIIILDHPGTTLNIAMAANIPMIGFWDKKAWAMCRQAIPFFDELEQVGIIFETGEEAAKKVNEIWGNVQEWWNQPEIQSARKSWCYQYARTSKTWWLDWIKFLWQI